MENRRMLARWISRKLAEPSCPEPGRIAVAAAELQALATELDDEELDLDRSAPLHAVAF